MASAAPASAETLPAYVSYVQQDGWGNTKYDVRFDGTVSPAGPNRYTIEGELDAYCSSGALTRQSVTFGYRNWNGTWQYKGAYCDETPFHISVLGTRHDGGSVEMVVGATSGVFNTYDYGNVEFYRIGYRPVPGTRSAVHRRRSLTRRWGYPKSRLRAQRGPSSALVSRPLTFPAPDLPGPGRPGPDAAEGPGPGGAQALYRAGRRPRPHRKAPRACGRTARARTVRPF
ncbi:hypothetical protein [Streptomyces sp. I6]|uniref:hypothetical protein n=1 Tax=Streptomyces sp. I6 TaxID=2483113 RepID=UPI000F45BEC1|nr:hypothetical protein [Streptomyces sp. I6]RNL68252.1 hypothetical protein EBF04_30105 [Streptomyces sp. I6]